MNIVQYGVYFVDDQFFIDFPDDYLKKNKEEHRPHYYCFKEDESGIIWLIPMSTKVEKYKRIISQRQAAHKPCDHLHILEIAGKESVFLIQDMFPITEEYLKGEFNLYETDKHLVLNHPNDIKELNKKARTTLSFLRRGWKYTPETPPDVLKIERELKSKLASK